MCIHVAKGTVEAIEQVAHLPPPASQPGDSLPPKLFPPVSWRYIWEGGKVQLTPLAWGVTCVTFYKYSCVLSKYNSQEVADEIHTTFISGSIECLTLSYS